MLYLHIGTPKAGSTSIQSAIGTEVETSFGHRQVAAFGTGNAWKLAAAAGTQRALDYWVKQRRALSKAEFDRLPDHLWQEARKEIGQAPSGSFIASSEYIYAAYGTDAAAIGRLKEALFGLFDDVRVIVYVRAQIPFLKSLYAQRINAAHTAESYEHFIATLEDHRRMWDYAAPLRVWAETFGTDRLRVVPFDARAFHGGDLIRDFLMRTDVDAADIRNFPPVAAANVSPTFGQLGLLRFGNMLPGRLRRLVDRPLRWLCVNRLTFGIGARDFPTTHDRAILEKVSTGNHWVNKTFLAGFSIKLPEV